MSSMLKKKGGLGAFKPKAPQVRRGPASTPTSSHGPGRSFTAERQSITPAPAPLVSSQDGTRAPSTALTSPRPAAGHTSSREGSILPNTTTNRSQTPATSTANIPNVNLPQGASTAGGLSEEATAAKTTRTGRSRTLSTSSAVNTTTEPSPSTIQPSSVSEQTSPADLSCIPPPRHASKKCKAQEEGRRVDYNVVEAALKRQKRGKGKVESDAPVEKSTVAEQQGEVEPSARSTHWKATPTSSAGGKDSLKIGEALSQGEKGSSRTPAAEASSTTASGTEVDTQATAQQRSTQGGTVRAPPAGKRRQGRKRTDSAASAVRTASTAQANVPTLQQEVSGHEATNQSANVENPAQNETGISALPKKRRSVKKKGPVNVVVNGNGSTSIQQDNVEAAQPKKKRRRKKAEASAEQQEGEEATEEGEAPPKKRRRERSVTPEDAEQQTVDHRELKMGDLTRDLRIGKKFSRHDELRDREREQRANYRQSRKPAIDGAANGDSEAQQDGEEAAAGAQANGTPTPETAEPASAAPAAVTGPQFEVIDGNIVLNQASLVHDRHAAADAEAGVLEEVEENDFSRRTTSSTYLKPGKLRGPNAWNPEQTEEFYRALSMFGTDFMMISKMFPGRSRRHIKMKFNREEKLNEQRINATIVGQKKVAIDANEYASRAGRTLESTEAILEEHRRREEEHDAEQKRLADETEEVRRKKREALIRPRPEDNTTSDADEDHGEAINGDEAVTETGEVDETQEEVDETQEIDETEEVE